MTKRILIFSLAYHPFVGGAEVAIKEITDRLGDIEFDMITVNLDGKQEKEEKIGNVKVYRVGNGKMDKYKFPSLAYRKALELNEHNQYSMTWAMMANQAGLAALKFKKKFLEIPYLLTLQEGDSEWDIWIRTWFMRPIYRAIYKRADYIQAISNFLAKRAKKLGYKDEVEIVSNGVKEIESPKSRHAEDGESRRAKVKSRQVVTVSRLVKKNGIEHLVRAMSNVDGELVILGDGKLKDSLEQLVKSLGMKTKVRFLGEVSNDNVYDHLSESAVFVRPSLSEGLGNAFLEAMSVGVPVIATPVGGILDFLEDGQTGWFCKVKDPKSIAEKISYVLDAQNKEEVNRVVDSAREMVEKKYNWNGIAKKMEEIFNKLIKVA